MDIEKDYIMRMIKEAVVVLTRLIFNKPGPMYELPDETKFTTADDLYVRLLKMADSGRINDAENLLYEEIQREALGFLEMGIGFYNHINEYEDDFLIANNYTREEIGMGLEQLLKEFNMDSMTELLKI